MSPSARTLCRAQAQQSSETPEIRLRRPAARGTKTCPRRPVEEDGQVLLAMHS